MNPQVYMISDEGIKVLAEKISEKIKKSFEDKISNNESEFLSIEETAKLIKLAKPTIYGLVHKKAIPHHKKGKRLYFLKSELLEWIKSGKRTSKSDIEKQADSYLLKNHLF